MVVGTATGTVRGRADLATWDLRDAGPERPEKLVLLDQLLSQHLAERSIERCFYEAPLPIAVLMKIGAREQTIQMLRSLVAVTEQACSRAGVMVGSWEVKRARQAVLGQGLWPKGKAKDGVMRGVRLLGYAPKNDNEADAAVGFEYQCAVMDPVWASVSGPLFMKRSA